MYHTITHITDYIYQEPVSLCHNIVRLTPRSTNKQFCKSSVITIQPEPDVLIAYEDFFGNQLVYFAIEKEHEQLSVQVVSEIEKIASIAEQAAPCNFISWEAAQAIIAAPNTESIAVKQFIAPTPMTEADEAITVFALGSFTPGRPMLEACTDLMQRIFTEFKFEPGFTTISTHLSVVMAERKGVCQDFAHLAIACIRSIGLPARYISGYIETLPAPGEEKLVGVDASHAWFSVYIPNSGWVDFDPTNNLLPADQHITIGWGRDYADITPLKGVIMSSGWHDLRVSVDVRRHL